MKKIVVTWVVVFICLATAGVPVEAASNTLSISPSVTKVVIQPDRSVSLPFNVENKGDPVQISVAVFAFKAADNYGHIALSPDKNGPIVIDVEGGSLGGSEPTLLKTGQTQTFNLNVSVPGGAPEQDYYYSVLVKTTPFPSSEGDSQLNFSSAIGANVVVSVSKDAQLETQAGIPLFSVARKYKIPFFDNLAVFDSTDVIPLVFMVKNSGRNFITPKGNILLKGWNIEKILPISEDTVLSNSQRVLQVGEKCEDSCGNGFSGVLKGVFIGKYDLSATVSFFEGSPQIYASTSFIAFPFKATFVIVLMAFIAFFSFKKLKK